MLYGGGCIVILLAVMVGWTLWFSPTRIAFVNYQVISLGQISKANDNSFIRISELNTDDIDRITDFDMVFINGMGLRITEAQREVIQKAADGAGIGKRPPALLLRQRILHAGTFLRPGGAAPLSDSFHPKRKRNLSEKG